MAPTFDAVALVSGGKDSVMAAMLAESYGHRVVALANLLPADADVEELDSHCFQTVGHRAVASYGDLTGLPLFRRRLRGSSMRTDISYEVGADDTLGDEVEDLRALLAAVVDATPGVRAVTAGAILSDYQRLRVEAVCADLGLVSLAYMWRQPQPRVLDLICASGVDAVLVKVAAMGLDPARHLGASLASLRATLLRVEREFGSHCAGEGGEFETLVLDCPLFRRGRLELVDPKVVVTSPDPFAPSGHLETAGGEVIPKRGGEGSRSSRDLAWGPADSPPAPAPAPAPARGGTPAGAGAGAGAAPRHLGTSAPDLPPGAVVDVDAPAPAPRVRLRTAEAFAAAAFAAGARFHGLAGPPPPASASSSSSGCFSSSSAASFARVFSGASASHALVSCRVAASHDSDASAAAGASAEAGLRGAFDALSRARPGATWADVDAVQLYVADLAHFAAVNEAYLRVVPAHAPPARACVELALPPGVPACVELLAAVPVLGPEAEDRVAPEPKRSLHVQSLSCWAPACIGPYAQAATRLGLTHLAGVIAMDPATLDVIAGEDEARDVAQARRAFRSAAAVARATGGEMSRDCVACVVFSVADAAGRAADEAFESLIAGGEAWSAVIDRPECEYYDASSAGAETRSSTRDEDQGEDEGEDEGEREDEDEGENRRTPPRDPAWAWRPLVTHARVPRLPKDARVEVQPVLLAGDGPGDSRGDSASDDDEGPRGNPARGNLRAGAVALGGEPSGAPRVRARSVFGFGRHLRATAAIERGGDVEAGMRACFDAFGTLLREAGLGWEDVGSCRGFVAAAGPEGPALEDAEGWAAAAAAAAAAAREGSEGSRSRAEPALAPVLAARFEDVEDAVVVLEMAAARRRTARREG